jgi:DNA adenine methylase
MTTTTDLIARCAQRGWAVQPDGDGWELRGNGAPAAFGSTASLVAWLERQERAAARAVEDGAGEARDEAMQKPMKPILKYPGSKARVAEWVVSHFPAHTHYVEPYFGSGVVLFNKPLAKHEIINDLSGDVCNLFRVIRDDGDRLAALIEMTPWSREEYDASSAPTESPMERARRFLVNTWQMHGTRTHENSKNQGWRQVGFRGEATTVDLWRKLPARLLHVTKRLQHTEIENCPALDLIGRYSGENVVLYCDPPYVLSTRSHAIYAHEMTDADHSALLDALDAHPGPVVLSGYRCPLYDDRLGHWQAHERTTQAEKGNTRTEVLWLNQVCVDRLGYGPMFEVPS